MDRLIWYAPLEGEDQNCVAEAYGVCLYDGDEKTIFECGTLQLFPTRMVWRNEADLLVRPLSLELRLIVDIESKSKSFTRSAKIVVYLLRCPPEYQEKGPTPCSANSFIKLSFRKGGEERFFHGLRKVLSEKAWLRVSAALPGRKTRAGIVGIERKLEERHRSAQHNIRDAFEDVDKLMNMAKDMVQLSRNISQKIRSKQGEISEDETVQFKSYLLSLGIEDPVTKSTHGTGDHYYKGLARELTSFLERAVQESGGMMNLIDAYCRINRARGFELISPEDLLNACQNFDMIHSSLKLHEFPSGVRVITSRSQDMAESLGETVKVVSDNSSLTSEEFAQLAHLPVVLAKEKLLYAETAGELCRDESVEGLRFFPNLFLQL